MPAVPIPWPTTSLPGRYPGESQGQLINAYAAKVGEEVRIRRVAGLKPYLVIDPPTPKLIPRGQLEVTSNLIHVWDETVFVRNGSGVNVTAVNGLPGSDMVTLAHNMRQPTPEVVIVAAQTGAVVLDMNDLTVKPYPAGEVGSVTTVEYYSGYFFFTRANGTFLASELQQTEVLAGSFAYAEYTADRLWRTKSIGNALAVMSASSIEFWVDIGAVPFPCQRQNAIDVGLLAPFAVAGGANDWENGLLWVAGDWTVRMLKGYDAVVVSNDDVSREIRNAAMNCNTETEFVAQVYVFNAQAIWSLTTPFWTWEYNLATGSWHKRNSHAMPNWRAVFACNYQGRWITQDRSGFCRLSEVSPNVFDEEKERLRFRVESAPLKEFPANVRIPTLDIDMTVGLGETGTPSPWQTDPVVMVSWSHDGGANWGNPVARRMGMEGRYATKVTVNNLGRSTTQGVMIRLEVVDPVWVQLNSAISTRTKMSRPRAVNQ